MIGLAVGVLAVGGLVIAHRGGLAGNPRSQAMASSVSIESAPTLFNNVSLCLRAQSPVDAARFVERSELYSAVVQTRAACKAAYRALDAMDTQDSGQAGDPSVREEARRECSLALFHRARGFAGISQQADGNFLPSIATRARYQFAAADPLTHSCLTAMGDLARQSGMPAPTMPTYMAVAPPAPGSPDWNSSEPLPLSDPSIASDSVPAEALTASPPSDQGTGQPQQTRHTGSGLPF